MIGGGSIMPPRRIDEDYTSPSDSESDSDESEFEPDADELAAAATHDETQKARRKGDKQDSGKIRSCQMHLADPCKAATHPGKENEDSIDKEGDGKNTKGSKLAIHWVLIHI